MSIDFDPIKVGPPPRRVEPLTIGVLAVVIALAMAVLKPWQPGGTLGGPPPQQAAVAASPPAPEPSPTAATPLAPLRTPTWRDLEPAIRTHDAWGVRVILSARRGLKPDPRVRFTEGWTSATATPAGLETMIIERDDRSIVALGITSPPGAEPWDVRIWRLGTTDEVERIDARSLDYGRADGKFLFLRFGGIGTGFQTWDAGRYRIDVIGNDGVRWINIEIPERAGGDEPPEARPAPEALVVGQGTSDSHAVRLGLFASVNGEGPPVEAPDWSAFDGSSWFDELRGPTVAPPQAVARAYLSRPTWLGVMLTPRASVRWATIRPLAADAGFDPVSGGVSKFHGQTPFVVFGSPSGGAWPAGLYAISVAWVDMTGPRIGTWHVELGRAPIQPAFMTRP